MSKLSSIWNAALGTVLGPGAAAENTPVAGAVAPLFEGVAPDGKMWKLADRLGRSAVLLYFYPKDDTPGCTREACSLRDRMSDLQRDNVEVVGVNFDDAEAHQKFIAKHRLNFPLLTDGGGKISDAYGARYREGCDMTRRVSFLIGTDGKIIHVTDTPSPEQHLAEMREAIEKHVRKNFKL